MVNILVSSNMVISSYRHGTAGMIVLITTDSSERRILNMYRGTLSIREKTHEPDDCARVWWWKRGSLERVCRVLLQVTLGSAKSRPNERSLAQK